MTTDDDRFRAYVEARRGDLLRTAVLLAAGDRWAAEDLVQTTLTRLYVAWSRVAPEAVDAYARRSLLNALIDHRRLATTRREHSATDLPETAVSDPAPDHTRAAVFSALGRLPPRMRAAVVMRHLLDLSVVETAEALGCREGTVKSQTARGLVALRTALRAEGIEVDPPPGETAEPVAAGVPHPPVRPAPDHVPSNT